MIKISDLENDFQKMEALGQDFTEQSGFIDLLLADKSPEMTEYHYNLLRRRKNYYLYLLLRAALEERSNIEYFLRQKAVTESDPDMQGDILHLLGLLKSMAAAPMAREYLNHDVSHHREVALYVLGWVGDKFDIALLNQHMLTESDPHLRITAASAHRQLASRHPELKCDVLRSLKTGFEKETNGDALSWIIVMIGTIAVKNLGLREDKEEPDVLHGDLERAKEKTAAFLKTLTFSD